MIQYKIGKWLSKNKIHLGVWFLYMFYETVLLTIIFDRELEIEIYLIHYVVTISFFYLHGNFTLPFINKKGKSFFWAIPILLVIELIIYIYGHYCATLFLHLVGDYKKEDHPSADEAFILRNLYRGILMMGYATGYYFVVTYLSERKKTQELEKDRLEKIIQQQQIEKELVNAQNAFLKAQINPHFLFNTLSFIYHKVNAHSAIAGDAVERLSDMMRFAIDAEEMGTTISLANEIEQVENLLFLYQIRKGTDLNVYFAYTEEVKKFNLIPLVLLTLVENIFKHGDISDPDEIAIIDLDLADDSLHIQTKNLIKKHKVTESHHAGLHNIHKRLSYAYGEQVKFQYQTIGPHFKVDIVIPVHLLTKPA